ncbi:hypothetical protein [Methylibium sp.]|nr:hypothetical protein [Methylibium sp.]
MDRVRDDEAEMRTTKGLCKPGTMVLRHLRETEEDMMPQALPRAV